MKGKSCASANTRYGDRESLPSRSQKVIEQYAIMNLCSFLSFLLEKLELIASRSLGSSGGLLGMLIALWSK
jgi:hypothetical protein